MTPLGVIPEKAGIQALHLVAKVMGRRDGRDKPGHGVEIQCPFRHAPDDEVEALLVGQRDELDLVSRHRAEMTGFPLRLCLLDAFLAG